MAEQADIVVVGAGGGGAILGLALARRGIKCLVLERAPGPPSGLRGEILQPNGQQILDRFGLLASLSPEVCNPVRQFHFCRVGGERLCTIDYGMLPPPYDRALVTLPNAAHHVILKALEVDAPGSLRYGMQFRGLVREGRRVTGVIAQENGTSIELSAKVVVGADGAFSKVRETLRVPTRLHCYQEGYLIAMLDNLEGLEAARYFVGRRTILGVFPAAGRKLYLFYMIPAGSIERIKASGLRALRDRWCQIDPSLKQTFQTLTDWEQTAYLPAARVQTGTWVTDGAVLIGDAAHAMNPHASQGRMQAMMDAMALSDVLAGCLEHGDYSASVLSKFERLRRPQVRMLQRLADEQVIFWNTGNPLLALLRDRVFRTLDHNRRLRYQVLVATAGLRADAPFGIVDRLMAAGLLPDPHADRLPPVTAS
ncbi:MAG: FAD-dependent oxidoreductase [Nitrospiraceae bacterium]